MIDQETIDECRAIMERRRAARRDFLRTSTSAVVAAGGLSLLAACDNNDDDISIEEPAPNPGTTPTPTASQNDINILNFALNLEYLEGNYYTFGAFGSGINSALTSGTGTQGAVTGGRQVTFTDAAVGNYIREIAADENAHITFIRNTLGTAAVAQPALNIAGDATGAFTAAARAAGVVPATGTFDPYANQDNFIIGALLLTDVGVTAYKGAARFIENKTFLEASAGILAVEAYHSGLLRTLLYRRGLDTAAIFTQFQQVSDARDALDGTADLDQGIANGSGPVMNGQAARDTEASNIVPTDNNGIVFGRTTAQVLNIAYLNRASVTAGGFFPSGVNGNIRASGAN
jgi:hypothetical protein